MAKKSISIIEVGARDGLQNESALVSIEDRVELIQKLADAGVKRIEAGAFVSPKWVPQMSGTAEILQKLKAIISGNPSSKLAQAQLSVLVPNEKGMDRALNSGVNSVAIFASASETFSKKNINCSIEESFSRFATITQRARQNRIKVRGYLSMCFGCPFEGDIPPIKVAGLVQRLVGLGVYEVSIGDTIGVADPGQVRKIIRLLKKSVPPKKIAMHFHDTRGTALANILASIDLGIHSFDTSLGGLGGCPYAPNATGNVATEDVVYMLKRMGFETHIDLGQLIQINKWIAKVIGRDLPSKVSRAGLPKRIRGES